MCLCSARRRPGLAEPRVGRSGRLPAARRGGGRERVQRAPILPHLARPHMRAVAGRASFPRRAARAQDAGRHRCHAGGRAARARSRIRLPVARAHLAQARLLIIDYIGPGMHRVKTALPFLNERSSYLVGPPGAERLKVLLRLGNTEGCRCHANGCFPVGAGSVPCGQYVPGRCQHCCNLSQSWYHVTACSKALCSRMSLACMTYSAQS